MAKALYISTQAVSKWERGITLPDVTLLFPLAKRLGITADELLNVETSNDFHKERFRKRRD